MNMVKLMNAIILNTGNIVVNGYEIFVEAEFKNDYKYRYGTKLTYSISGIKSKKFNSLKKAVDYCNSLKYNTDACYYNFMYFSFKINDNDDSITYTVNEKTFNIEFITCKVKNGYESKWNPGLKGYSYFNLYDLIKSLDSDF